MTYMNLMNGMKSDCKALCNLYVASSWLDSVIYMSCKGVYSMAVAW